MSLTAKYDADFNDFYSATQQATTKLEAWESAGSQVEAQMNDVATSLSGAPLVPEATAAAGAMQDLSGATAEVPPHLQDIAAQGSILPSIFGHIAAAAAGAFTFQAITNFAIGVVQLASDLGDMSEKLGVSVETLQRFKYAAEQSGATVENVERAITTMNQKLAGGDQSTMAALEAVGVSFEDIRAMNPEDAFHAIGEAVGGIADPMMQAKIATDLFGRAGVELIPAFEAGLKKIGEQTNVMSADTVRRLKEAEDAWGRLMNMVTIASGGMIAKMFRTGEVVTATFAAMADPLNQTKVDAMIAAITGTSASLDQLAARAPQAETAIAGLLRPLVPAAAAVGGLEVAFTDLTQAATFSTQVIGLVEPKLGSLADFTRRAAKETESAREYTDLWNTGLRFTSEVIGELPPKLEAVAVGIKTVAAEQAAMSKHAPGSVGVATGGTQIANMEEAFKKYSATYGGGSALGMVGGGPAKDFLSWALERGYASKQGAAPTVNVTMNGMLGTNDPQTRQMLTDVVGQAFTGSMRGQRLLSSA